MPAKRADRLYDRLMHDEFSDAAEQINLERDLVAALTGGCERAIIGYRLRGDFYSDDFSNGIENLLINSQAGFNTPVFVRTVKLKDFPWNGWLRLGIDGRPAAAWNPVAGFTDAAGRLVWSAVGDNAFLPVPYNSRWVANRVEIRPGDGPKTRQSFRIPSDAMVPEPRPAGSSRSAPTPHATGKVTYKVLASAFHDGSEMEPADFLYPYALALRWGEDRGRQDVRSGDRGRNGGDAPTVQGRARRQRGRKQDRACRSHFHLPFADRRGVSRRQLIRPADERAAGAALELGAVACAGPDGSGGRARDRGILAVRGDSGAGYRGSISRAIPRSLRNCAP